MPRVIKNGDSPAQCEKKNHTCFKKLEDCPFLTRGWIPFLPQTLLPSRPTGIPIVVSFQHPKQHLSQFCKYRLSVSRLSLLQIPEVDKKGNTGQPSQWVTVLLTAVGWWRGMWGSASYRFSLGNSFYFSSHPTQMLISWIEVPTPGAVLTRTGECALSYLYSHPT